MTNYLLATWSGKRRNPSKDYLRAQIAQLKKIAHSLDQITIVRPLGSNDPEYYDVDLAGCTVIDRPKNDRAYGQFLYAYRQHPGFDYYILVEDDYLPNVDFFDMHLINMLEDYTYADNATGYLCGSYGPIIPGGPSVPRHNIGIIRGKALRKILKETPNPEFYPNGENDGQEQEMFGELCRRAGVTIADYSAMWPVPYYDRYLRYFSEKRGKETMFVPYQLLHGKALGYHGEEGDENSHFLSTMEFHTAGDEITIKDRGNHIGAFTVLQQPDKVNVYLAIEDPAYIEIVKDRIIYECRGREVYFK